MSIKKCLEGSGNPSLLFLDHGCSNLTDLPSTDLLLNSQVHNGDQLSGFLLHFVASNFLAFEKTEEFQKLTGENLSYVKEHQWPPLSYINAMEEWKEKYGEDNTSTVKNNINTNCVVM